MSPAEWTQAGLDVVLIALVGTGLVQAARLLRHLVGLRQGRVDMERFVQEFSSTVLRAEVGIKGLRQAAREGGDDLEKLIEKGSLLRDELHFLVESADQIAGRLGETATHAMRASDKASADKSAADRAAAQMESASAPEAKTPESVASLPKKAGMAGAKPASRAEKELMQALEKLG
jgi:hypothetical protein